MSTNLDGIGQTGLFLSAFLDDALLYFLIIFAIGIVASIFFVLFFPIRRVNNISLSEKIRNYEILYSIHQSYGGRR